MAAHDTTAFLNTVDELMTSTLAQEYIGPGTGVQIIGVDVGIEFKFRPNEFDFRDRTISYLTALRKLLILQDDPANIYKMRNFILQQERNSPFLSEEDKSIIQETKGRIKKIEVSGVSSPGDQGERTISYDRGTKGEKFLNLVINADTFHNDQEKRSRILNDYNYPSARLEGITLFSAYSAICKLHPIVNQFSRIIGKYRHFL
jgi:hypothetical protein